LQTPSFFLFFSRIHFGLDHVCVVVVFSRCAPSFLFLFFLLGLFIFGVLLYVWRFCGRRILDLFGV
jgi:hypothetical protein